MIMTLDFKKTPWTDVMLHVLFWALYVLSEYFANLIHLWPGRQADFFKAILLTLPALIIPTYLITSFVVPRYLTPGKWWLFLLWITGIGVVLFFFRLQWAGWIEYLLHGEYFDIPASKMLKNIIRDYAIIALAVSITIIGDYRKNQKLNEQLIRARAEAEIKLLKGQLHPHFLFNSLNNIYSLALMKSEQTADSILKLTELLDYLLYHANKEKVSLAREVQLLQNYMALEQLRYGDKLRIETEIRILHPDIMVAPLILLPFAENCFKHGGPGADLVFRIRMKLETDEKRLGFTISNSKRSNAEQRQMNGGVGLDNIRQRLTLLYPGRHRLEIADTADRYTVNLEILLKNDDV